MRAEFFTHNRTQESIESGDNDFSVLPMADNQTDKNTKSVISDFFGMKKRKAVFIEGLGAVLLGEGSDSAPILSKPNRIKTQKKLPYPYGDLPQMDTVFSSVDYNLLKNAVENAFDKSGEALKKTRSLLVIYKDQIIAEKYAPGFDTQTPILGWSMTKSITSTIYGILQKQGRIDINQKTGIEAWKNDARSAITYNDLLQMNSGLEWDEDYNDISDVTSMLYIAYNMGEVQLNKPMVGKINESWNYSSGTSNLLAGPLLRKYFPDQQSYLNFWYDELLDKIGMHSAQIETDLTGNFVGSSYAWANTRDWGKFGLLYLHEGNWNGEQIFEPSWAKYVATPTNGSNGRYGGHFWLNAGGIYPDAPRDLYSANGFQGQMVFIIPSKKMVIVRTGLTEDPEFDFNLMLKEILKAIN
ncbi:MAG: serine hydrolase [Flavobacteriaceae bacterium]|nr:serine hydrolase [Flavobacteriaceae bacterium]